MYRLFGHNNPQWGVKRSNEIKLKMRKSDEFKKQVSLRQTGRVKTKNERLKIQLGAIRYLYHFQNSNEKFYGVWDIATFCNDHNINYKVLRNLFSINKEKIKYKMWNIWRTELPKFSSSFFTNYLCSSYPCHDFESINCLFCYCCLYVYDCGGNFTILKNGIKDCSNCEIPHRQDGYDYVVRFLKNKKEACDNGSRLALNTSAPVRGLGVQVPPLPPI